MGGEKDSKSVERRRQALRLLWVVLSVFLIILCMFIFAPDILGASLYGNSIFTVGLFVSFLFIIFIIYITYVYAYPGKDDSE